MNAEKANIQTGVDSAEIPEYVFESLARSLLPVIQKYYESADGKKIRYNKLRKFQIRRIENSPQKTRDKVSVIW